MRPLVLMVVLCLHPVAAGEILPSGYWVQVLATAYSPNDPLDHEYHASKGTWRNTTADGTTDVRDMPYGIAVPRINGRPLWPYGTTVIIPPGSGYLQHSHTHDRAFFVDDTGSIISRRTAQTGEVHIDLRFRSVKSAREWGADKRIWIYICDGVRP